MLVVIVTAVAFVFMLVMVVTAVAFVVMFVMMIVAAAAVFIVVVMGMAAGATGGLRRGIPGVDNGTVFDGTGDGSQFGDQRVGVVSGDAKLFGGESDGGFLDLGMGVKFGLNLGSAVGAVQIVYDIDLFCHWVASLYELTYEQSFM